MDAWIGGPTKIIVKYNHYQSIDVRRSQDRCVYVTFSLVRVANLLPIATKQGGDVCLSGSNSQASGGKKINR